MIKVAGPELDPKALAAEAIAEEAGPEEPRTALVEGEGLARA
jgi:hypothetical protein